MRLATTKASIDLMKAQDPTTINATAGKTITFKLGANEMPFTAENFVLTNDYTISNKFFRAKLYLCSSSSHPYYADEGI